MPRAKRRAATTASGVDWAHPGERAAFVKSCRDELAAARARLREEYAARPQADRVLTALCTLVDECIGRIARAVPLPPEVALVAVGGYGRGYLFPASDVDLVVLVEVDAGAVSRTAAIETFVGLLWDVGLEPGIAVRSIAECVAEASKDITVATSLLEARHVWGCPHACRALVEALRGQRDVRAFCEAKIDEQRRRHERHNDVAMNLEPNVKESPGGLRDLQTVMWIAKAAGLGQTWSALAQGGLISEFEAKTIAKLRLTLVDLRIRLHWLAGRREDRLVFDHQTALARELGIVEERADGKRASEILMQRYYLAAKGVWQMNSILIPALMESVAARRTDRIEKIDAEFCLVNGHIAAHDAALFERDPLAILRAFLALQRVAGAEFFDPQTLRAMWRAVHRIDAKVRADPRTWRLFLDILRAEKLTFALRRMSRYGVLGRLIPPFGRITGQMQHDLFHVYTVDEHILMVIRNLRRLVLPRFAHEFPFCHELARDFPRPEVLYVAALFHDIAKGRGGDHSLLGKQDARAFCRKLALSAGDAELVAWLVECHLAMSAVAQKQDLNDPEVIAQFASLVRDERRLTALYLLTVADIRGTSPHVWNNWKARLLEQLFRATRRLLRGDAVHNERWIENKKTAALALLAGPDGAPLRPALWARVDESYFQRFDADEIAWHAAGHAAHDDPMTTPLVEVRREEADDGSERFDVLVMTRDQPGLFARITGFFERIGGDIAAARVYTARDGLAIDQFQVLPKNSARAGEAAAIQRQLARHLQSHGGPLAVSGRIARQVRHFPIEPVVALSQSRRAGFWELSLSCADRPGLLSAIARVFHEEGVDLHDARVTTLGSRAEDVFVIAHAALGEPHFNAALEAKLAQAVRV
jgi:[protein-PII] uridylyltransferase